MITRALNLWNQLRSSLWLVPALMSAAAFGLALAAGRMDRALAVGGPEWLHLLLYRGDLEGARTLLATVAGSMITVAGVTFSVTVVALSLASSQFGPRLLLSFMRDRGNQLVLGTFISTFLFCLVALGSGGKEATFLPSASASIGLLLALASVALLIYFVHHVASSIHAEHVVDVVARDVSRAVDRILLAEPGDEGAEDEGDVEIDLAEAGFVAARESGYIQAVDEPGLLAIASEAGVVIRLLCRPGQFVIERETLAAVVPGSGASSELADRIQQHFIVGRHRTDEQDPEYGIHQLVEVAVRALSPSVNDPRTAISCIDWLASALHRVARGRMRSPARTGAEGELRLVCDPITFEGLVGAAFDQIRQCSYATPAVSIRMMESLASIARATGDPVRCQVLRKQADVLLAGALEAGMQKTDQADLEARHRAACEAIGS